MPVASVTCEKRSTCLHSLCKYRCRSVIFQELNVQLMGVSLASLQRVRSGILVILVTLQHDLNPKTLTSGLKGLDCLLQRESVGHEGLHVHFS